jgi:hypothetical protein
MKQLANWRGARVASLVPNVLPRAEAAACVTRGSCWCSCDPIRPADCLSLQIWCLTCYGRVKPTGIICS